MTTANGHFLLSSYLWFLNILQWKCIMCSKKKKKSYFATRFRMPNSCLRQVMCHLYSTTLSIQFSRSVVSDSLRPHEPQHARPPCPSPAPRVYPNPCPLSQWWHPTISSSVIPFSSCLQSFPALGSFSNESALRIRWPKYWSFSFNISPSNEHPGLISFRMDWLDLLPFT